MESTVTYLQRLSTETHKPENEVLSMAFQVGLRQLWREHLLGNFYAMKWPVKKLLRRLALIWSNWLNGNIRLLWRIWSGR